MGMQREQSYWVWGWLVGEGKGMTEGEGLHVDCDWECDKKWDEEDEEVEILPEGEAAMVVSPSYGNDGDEYEDTVADGKHWTSIKRGEEEGDNDCKDTLGEMGGICWFSLNRTWWEKNSLLVVTSKHLYAFWVWEWPRKTQGQDLGWSLLVLYGWVKGLQRHPNFLSLR